MSAEEFLQCLNANRLGDFTPDDAMRLAEIAAPLSEAERRKLSKTAVEKHRASAEHFSYSSGYGLYLQLAVLAVGPLSAAKRLHSFFQLEPVALKILCDRRPDWADEWLAAQLSKQFVTVSWWLYRELLRAGVVTKPNTEDYVRFLVTINGATEPWTNLQLPGRTEYLLQNPEFIDDLWRFFEVETQVFFSFFLQTSGIGDGAIVEDWATTFIRLCELGHINRQRLLAATVRALAGDFSNAAFTGYVRFYERLNPSVDERTAGQVSFCELLASRTSHVVKFALDQLSELHKAGRLDGTAFLDAAPAVFAQKPKGHPLAVLSIASKLAKAQPELTTEAANVAIEALAHESSDVQAAAVKLLEAWKARLHRDHASELRARLEGIAASIRPRVQSLIDGLDSRGVGSISEPVPNSFSLDDWRARAEKVPQWRSLAGVDDALAAAESDQPFLGIWFNVNHVPVLTSCALIVPIKTVDELLDVVAHIVERVNSADEVERILDGVSRLCDQRPADFEHRAKPLIKRLLAERPDYERGILAYRMTPKLPQLLLRWLSFDLANKPVEPLSRWLGRPLQQVEDPRALTKFIERRLREIEARVAVGRPAPLLSAPTHQHGWLDPRVFVERLAHYVATPPPIADLIQALLRLAPEHRETALEKMPDLPGEMAAPVRYALGGPVSTSEIAADDGVSVWFAAGRSRQAYGPLAELAVAAGPARAPLLAETTFPWETVDDDAQNRWVAGRSVGVRIAAEPQLLFSPASALHPTLAVREENSGHGPEWCLAWMHALTPANLDGILLEGVRQLCLRLNSPASSLEPNHLYLQPLLAPDRPWNELTWLALWIALVSKDAGSRGMAIDVLIAGIEDGRAEVKCDVLLKLVQGPWLKLNRLAEAGREVARVSTRHAWWWAELLQRLLSQLPQWPGEIHHVLALLVELLSELQLGLREQFRPQFEAQPVTGKAAKLLKALLTIKTVANAPQRNRAHELALEACCQRAERWASSTKAL